MELLNICEPGQASLFQLQGPLEMPLTRALPLSETMRVPSTMRLMQKVVVLLQAVVMFASLYQPIESLLEFIFIGKVLVGMADNLSAELYLNCN